MMSGFTPNAIGSNAQDRGAGRQQHRAKSHRAVRSSGLARGQVIVAAQVIVGVDQDDVVVDDDAGERESRRRRP